MKTIFNLPEFPDSEQINLTHQRIFKQIFQVNPPPISDLVFTNLLGWQKYFNYRICCYQNFLIIFSQQQNTITFLPPLPLEKSLAATGENLFSLLQNLTDMTKQFGHQSVWQYFPDVYLQYLKGKAVKLSPGRDNFDYVYSRQSLVELRGQKFSAKRNFLKQFERLYNYQYEPLGPKNLLEVYRFIRHWSNSRPTLNQKLIRGENQLAFALIRNFPFLPLTGGLIRVEKKIVAVTIATLLEKFYFPDGFFPTAVIHIEKATTSYKGAYQTINYLFCKNLPVEIARINREEDLGLPGLRQAKLSYHPLFLLSKSRLWIE